MDRLDELAVFMAIVEEGGLTAAARRLRRSTPSVTRVLAALEARVGARLLERTTRHVSATEAGIALVTRSRSLLADYSTAISDSAAAKVQGLIRVTAPFALGRLYGMKIVKEFVDAYPDVRVDLLLNDRYVDLIQEGIDVAIRVGKLADSSLVARQVGLVRGLIVVGSPEYLAERGTPKKPADLAKHDIIFATMYMRSNEWRFDAEGRSAVVRLTPKISVNDAATQIAAAKAGYGLARVMCYQVTLDVNKGELVRVLKTYEPELQPLQLVTPSADVTPKVRAFLDFAAAALEKLDAVKLGNAQARAKKR
jgi:DNA-binding transcriptional LysR family regulator